MIKKAEDIYREVCWVVMWYEVWVPDIEGQMWKVYWGVLRKGRKEGRNWPRDRHTWNAVQGKCWSVLNRTPDDSAECCKLLEEGKVLYPYPSHLFAVRHLLQGTCPWIVGNQKRKTISQQGRSVSHQQPIFQAARGQLGGWASPKEGI